MKALRNFAFIFLAALTSGCFHATHMRVEPPSRIEAIEQASHSALTTALMLFVDQLDGRVLGASDFELARSVIQRLRSNDESTLSLLLAYAELRTDLVEIPNARERAQADLRQLLQFAGYVAEPSRPVKSDQQTDPQIKQVRLLGQPFLYLASLPQPNALATQLDSSAQSVRSILDAMRAYAIADNASGIKRTIDQFVDLARLQAENPQLNEDQITETEIAEALTYAIASSPPRRAATLLALPGIDPRDVINALLEFSAESGIALDRPRFWRILYFSELPSAERAAFVLQSVTPQDVPQNERSAALRHVATNVRELTRPIESSDEQVLAELFIQLASDTQWRDLVSETLEKLTDPRARAFGWLRSLATIVAEREPSKATIAPTDSNDEVSRRIEQALLEALGDLSTRERIELLLEIDDKMSELKIAPTAAMQSLLKRMLSISWRELTP